MSRRRPVTWLFIGFLAAITPTSIAISDEGSGPGETSADTTTNTAPLPAPGRPPDLVRLSPAEELGKDIFFDATLSMPVGYSCATCHLPGAGFTGSSSLVNEQAGPMPGIIPGRSGHRKPQAVPYANFSPRGPRYDDDLDVWLGGNFWDGRAPDTAAQARMPFLDPDEMANTPVGPYPPHDGGYSPLVAEKLRARPYSRLFLEVFGPGVGGVSDAGLYDLATRAIAAYEASAEVDPFSSKYDASGHGVPARGLARLTPAEEAGLTLFFGKAQCSACHSSATLAPVLATTGGKDVFTMYCYANVGTPKNLRNPFYGTAARGANPFGANPLGGHFVDYGIGGNPNPSPDGDRFMLARPGDIAQFRGLFKAPTVRNVDRRPDRKFVKSYMHNGVFRSLGEVVHFYNKRNIAANQAGREVAFDLRLGPPRGFMPLFPPPEVLENVQNVAGVSPAAATDEVESNGQVGNLGLTPIEEEAIVQFLKTLSDGYTRPNP